jgi:hypothetical protein
MKEGTISCPNCGHEFELSEALTDQIEEHLRSELLREVKEREAELHKKQKSLSDQQEKVDDLVEQKLAEQLKEVRAKAEKKAQGDIEVQLRDLQESLAEKDSKLSKARELELEFRKKTRALEDQKAEIEVELSRKLDAERDNIAAEAKKQYAEEHNLKVAEKDRTIEGLRKSLEDAQRKAEQGSMENQGEVLEEDMEAKLAQFFPHDEVSPVKKGVRGADVIQQVVSPVGADCGTLLWEAKTAKTWSSRWIPKLKDDQLEARASIAILVTQIMPEGVDRFGYKEGVWVTDIRSAIPLAVALRQQLIVLAQEQQASVGKNEKMEMLYQYLAGTQFRQKIEGIVEGFSALQDQVIKERRAMERQWKEREKGIERVMKNTVGMYGDMQGIIGATLPQIKALEIDGGERDVPELPLTDDGDIEEMD